MSDCAIASVDFKVTLRAFIPLILGRKSWGICESTLLEGNFVFYLYQVDLGTPTVILGVP